MKDTVTEDTFSYVKYSDAGEDPMSGNELSM